MTEKEEIDRARFGMKVLVDLDTGCHEWHGMRTQGGYGQFSLDGRRQLAHRVAWAWTYGPIPKGQLVCHHCDNRRCVNVLHLFLGSHRDNMQDALNKGRMKRVSNAGRQRILTTRKQAVLDAYAAGESVADICARFNYTRQGVLYVVNKFSDMKRPRGRVPRIA